MGNRSLRCQFVTLNNNGRGQHKKYLPYAFTEQGIAMLSALLKSDVAVKVSIKIMKAFIEMRKFISNNGHVFERFEKIEYKLLELDNKFNEMFNELQKGKNEEFKQQIFFDGQIDWKKQYKRKGGDKLSPPLNIINLL